MALPCYFGRYHVLLVAIPGSPKQGQDTITEAYEPIIFVSAHPPDVLFTPRFGFEAEGRISRRIPPRVCGGQSMPPTNYSSSVSKPDSAVDANVI